MKALQRLNNAQLGLVLVISIYLCFYAYLIHGGEGIPYVMDNNETFSAFNHASNLWNFDFWTSFGLPDEAMSPYPSAHPVIHSHQGDFPRLFSFILYALGIRTPELQVWVTTFSIGAISIVMAYYFFLQLAGALYAVLASLTLLTDYLLFAQWQVNTYRVWHGFFLFGAALCVHGLAHWKRRNWIAATLLLYAALLYWELIFAAFVCVTFGLYTVWIYRNSWRQIFIAGATQLLGAALGIGLLIGQLVLYMGWSDTLADLTYTYAARNLSDDPGTSAAAIIAFYEKKNIIFLANFQPSVLYDGLLSLLRSVSVFVLQVQTPFFVFVVSAGAVAALIADSRLPGPSEAKVAAPAVSVSATGILAYGLFILWFSFAFTDEAFLGIRSEIGVDVGSLSALFVLAALLSGAIAWQLRSFASKITISGSPPAFRRCAVAAAYLLIFAIFTILQKHLYNASDQDVWSSIPQQLGPTVGRALMALSLVLGSMLILCGRRSLLGACHLGPKNVGMFLLAGTLGYAVVYRLSAGYLHSGYLYRLCPFFVFHLDAFLALGLFTLVVAAKNEFRKFRENSLPSKHGLAALLYGCLAVTCVGYWTILQYRYYELLPPDRFSFLPILKAQAAGGEGIASNTYAVPFGILAGTWAYTAPFLAEQLMQKSGFHPRLEADYRWFADKEVNASYERPTTFVCFFPFGAFTGLIHLDRPRIYNVPRCADMIEEHDAQVVEVAKDPKYDMWAIYRLNWSNK